MDIPSKLHEYGRQYALSWCESLERVCAAHTDTLLSTFYTLPPFYRACFAVMKPLEGYKENELFVLFLGMSRGWGIGGIQLT